MSFVVFEKLRLDTIRYDFGDIALLETSKEEKDHLTMFFFSHCWC